MSSLPTRYRTMLAAVVAALIGVSAITAAAHRRRPPILRAWIAVMAADWLDDVIDDAGGILGTILKPVKAFVRNVVRPVVSWLLDRIRDVVSAVVGSVTDIWGFVWRSIEAIAHAINNVYQYIGSAVDRVTGWVWARLQDVYNTIAARIGDMVRWVGDRIAELWSFANGLKRWVTDHVLAPFLNFVRDIFRWIDDHVLTPLWNGIRAVARSLGDAVDWIADRLGSLLRFVDWFMGTVWTVLNGAWDWLTFLARWGFDAVRRLLDGDWVHPSWWVQRISVWFAREGDDAEEWLTRWLG